LVWPKMVASPWRCALLAVAVCLICHAEVGYAIKLDETFVKGLRQVEELSSLLDFHLSKINPMGIEGVNCTIGKICDRIGICAEYCQPGTVEIDAWLKHAMRDQIALQRDTPFCYLQYAGTHNSAISRAYGYGTEDLFLQDLLRFFTSHKDTEMVSANQKLSLTDQLNLGVRMIEIDTHLVHSRLTICHAGGVDVPAVNNFVQKVADLLHVQIDWDTELLGCDPGFSDPSLEVPLRQVLGEIREWMGEEENKEEVVIAFFDDQIDLQTWGVVGDLVKEVEDVFGQMVFTPPNKRDFSPDNHTWPTPNQMLEMGKRIIFMSGTDYTDMHDVIFHKTGPYTCDWSETNIGSFQPYPKCALGQDGSLITQEGTITRPISDSIVYGPFYNGTGGDSIITDERLPAVTECAINFPCIDQAVPTSFPPQVWSWSEGEPRWSDTKTCVVLDSSSGRWHTSDCSSSYPRACYDESSRTFYLSDDSAACPPPSSFGIPSNGKLNQQLLSALRSSSSSAVYLNYTLH